MSAWLVKTRRAPARHSRNARAYGHTTTATHKYRVHLAPYAFSPDVVSPVDIKIHVRYDRSRNFRTNSFCLLIGLLGRKAALADIVGTCHCGLH